MSTQLLCIRCAKLLKLTGFDAVNKVRRKNCVGCGDNQDNLVVVNAKLCDEAIDKWNNNERKELTNQNKKEIP